MSAEHHASDPRANEAFQRFLSELAGQSERKWPHGRVAGEDDGETAFAIATDLRRGYVRIQFTKPMSWIGLDVASATALRDKLTEKIGELNAVPHPPAP